MQTAGHMMMRFSLGVVLVANSLTGGGDGVYSNSMPILCAKINHQCLHEFIQMCAAGTTSTI